MEAGFAVLSVEYFVADGAAAALLFAACVVCVATAAFQACAFPRIFTLDVVCHQSDIDWMVTHQCQVRRGLGLPLRWWWRRQRQHHGWKWPTPHSKSLNAGSHCLFALSLAPAPFMPPAPCPSLTSLSWFPSPLLCLRPPSTSRSRGLSFWVATRWGRLELGETLLWHEGSSTWWSEQGVIVSAEWYCVRCQRGGCWATKFSCFRCGLSHLESEAATGGFPQPTGEGGGKGKGVFRESQYLGRASKRASYN